MRNLGWNERFFLLRIAAILERFDTLTVLKALTAPVWAYSVLLFLHLNSSIFSHLFSCFLSLNWCILLALDDSVTRRDNQGLVARFWYIIDRRWLPDYGIRVPLVVSRSQCVRLMFVSILCIQREVKLLMRSGYFAWHRRTG
jgi:hypothetical protein